MTNILSAIMTQNNVLYTYKMEGEMDGERKATERMARKMKAEGYDATAIQSISGLTMEEIEEL